MDLMSQIRALEGPVIDRKRLTSMSSRDVARRRNNETFAKQIKKRVGILRNVSIFKEMSDEELAKAAEAFAEVTKECGEAVINQGDIGDEFFIISSGRALVLFHVSDDQPDKVLAKIGANAFFGELALLTDEPRSASIERRAWEVLSGLGLFASLPEMVVRGVVSAMKIVKYQPGTYIVQQGREGKAFYVILEGIVKVTKNDPDHPCGERPVGELGDHDYFGEVAMLSQDHMRTANVVTITQTVCFSLDRDVFQGTHNAAMGEELRRRRYFAKMSAEGCFSGNADRPLGRMTSTRAGISFKKRLMRIAFRGLMTLVVGVLSQCKTFSTVYCHDWPHAAKIDFGHHVRVEQVDQGDVIYDSSERATRCYVVVRGTVTVLNGDQGTQQVPDEVEDTPGAGGAPLPKRATFWQIQGDFVEKATPGSTLGLESLDEPADARRVFYRHNAVALTDCVLLVFGYMDYYSIRGQVDAGCVSDVEEKYALLKDMGLMDGVGQEQLYHVAYALKEVHAPRGKTLLREARRRRRSTSCGAAVTVFAAGIEVNTINKGEYFGESGILPRRPVGRAATSSHVPGRPDGPPAEPAPQEPLRGQALFPRSACPRPWGF
ncbi:cAMP-dependent protein kinase regulator [Aureococcus anophagefferens]|nr:cAMP-dependent protein kinase regulator [Aureococcus anophagefferens]